MTSIPVSLIVSVTPQVLSAGGTALDILGMFLTNNTRVPVGQVLSFPNQLSVASYFGSLSDEATAASKYFLGFTKSNRKPASILFAQYPSQPVAAYVRGANLGAMSLATLKTLSGTLIVNVDGATKTSSAISLSAATSFSNAATIIAAAFTSLGGTVSYDSTSGGFTITSATTGATSTMSTVTGTLAGNLGLSAAAGAVVSPGAPAGDPTTNMNQYVAITQNWVTFTTLFEPQTSDKLLFANWTNAQGNRYAYINWDSDVVPTLSNAATASSGYIIKNVNAYSGVFSTYNNFLVAAMAMGSAASIDFTELNGRVTFAFMSQEGLAPTVTNAVVATNLRSNGYNFYGNFASANDQFNFLFDGQVSGQFKWFDSYINQIAMTNAFQLALVNLLVNAKSVPYNLQGRVAIETALLDPVLQFLDFGAIRAGVTLSAAQIAQVNADAGIKIDKTLSERGWYIQVKDALPIVRAARTSPPCTIWYMDGGSVQQINLTSIELQ